MKFFYVSSDVKEKQKILIKNYLKKQSDVKIVVDAEGAKKSWIEKPIYNLLIQNMKMGDTLIVYDAADLAPSTAQICEILSAAALRKISIDFIKYECFLANNTTSANTINLIKLIMRVESDFVSKRTVFALAKRRAAGLPLGRPKGRGNKSLKLDKHKEEIEKYLKLEVSKSSIAKIIGCHAQTLYDWLERRAA